MSGTWTTQYRGDIAVYLCTTTFTTQFPSWNQDLLINNVKLALDNWNTYGGVDFRLRYAGERTSSTSGGCAASQNPANGEITIKAEASRPGDPSGPAAAASWNGPNITLATISMYKTNSAGTPYTWTFDHEATGITFVSVLQHELGHTLGFPDISSVNPRTVMGTSYPDMRVLWHEDIAKLRDPSQTYHYNNVTTRQIRHTRSTNNGVSWAAEGNLQEFTNSRVAVAFNPTASKYMVAWRGTGGNTNVNTILGNGASYDAASKKVHSLNTDVGPAVAYGNGRYVVARVSASDSRRIGIVTSTDGITWTATSNVTYNGSTSYGSMWEPELAYSTDQNTFILAWTNWLPGASSDDGLSRMRFCTSPDPATTPFANCFETTNSVLTTPAVTCQSTPINDCMVAWQNHVGTAGHQICYRKGSVQSTGFTFSGSTFCFNSDGSRMPTALAQGNSNYVLGWRGSDGSNTANTLRQTTWPSFVDRAFPDSPLQVGPDMAFGSTWSEFAFYYVRR